MKRVPPPQTGRSRVQALEVQLPAPISHVCLNARPPYKCLVSFAGSLPPVITDLESSQEQMLPVLGERCCRPGVLAKGRRPLPGY